MNAGERLFAAIGGFCIGYGISIVADAYATAAAREAVERQSRVAAQLAGVREGNLKRELEREQELVMRAHLADYHAEAEQEGESS